MSRAVGDAARGMPTTGCIHGMAGGDKKLMAEASGGGTENEPALTTVECRIMVYKLLQCDPNKVWAKNYLHTFSNRSGRRISSAGGSEDTDTASTGAIPRLTNGKGRKGRNPRSMGMSHRIKEQGQLSEVTEESAATSRVVQEPSRQQ